MPNKKKIILSLCLVQKDGQVLLGLKKRGFGAGRWNGFGGKLEAGETIDEAARRELFEESGLRAEQIDKLGVIDFEFIDTSEILEVHIFRCAGFSGQPSESDEMRPKWFPEGQLPLDEMWSDDKYWLPLFLAGKRFSGHFLFDSEKNNKIIKYSVVEIDKI